MAAITSGSTPVATAHAIPSARRLASTTCSVPSCENTRIITIGGTIIEATNDKIAMSPLNHRTCSSERLRLAFGADLSSEGWEEFTTDSCLLMLLIRAPFDSRRSSSQTLYNTAQLTTQHALGINLSDK